MINGKSVTVENHKNGLTVAKSLCQDGERREGEEGPPVTSKHMLDDSFPQSNSEHFHIGATASFQGLQEEGQLYYPSGQACSKYNSLNIQHSSRAEESVMDQPIYEGRHDDGSYGGINHHNNKNNFSSRQEDIFENNYPYYEDNEDNFVPSDNLQPVYYSTMNYASSWLKEKKSTEAQSSTSQSLPKPKWRKVFYRHLRRLGQREGMRCKIGLRDESNYVYQTTPLFARIKRDSPAVQTSGSTYYICVQNLDIPSRNVFGAYYS